MSGVTRLFVLQEPGGDTHAVPYQANPDPRKGAPTVCGANGDSWHVITEGAAVSCPACLARIGDGVEILGAEP